MNDQPHPDEDPTPGSGSNPQPSESSGPPLHAEFKFQPLSARVPEQVSSGQFANGAIVMSGPHEFLIDFVLRLNQPNSIVSRIILPLPVTDQFIKALRANVRQYESTFGPIPPTPKPLSKQDPHAQTTHTPPQHHSSNASAGSPPNNPSPGFISPGDGIAAASIPQEMPHQENVRPPVQIDDIYDGLKFPEKFHAGHYANAVLIRNTNTEFCLDFLANFYPRPIVVCRILMAVGQVMPFLNSLSHSYDQRFRNPHN